MSDDLPLLDQLVAVAENWAAMHKATLAKLGRLVINDGGFFDRVQVTRSTTTITLEKFARFFADPANWPEGVIAPAASEFAHVVIGSTSDGGAASGLAHGMSGAQEQAA